MKSLIYKIFFVVILQLLAGCNKSMIYYLDPVYRKSVNNLKATSVYFMSVETMFTDPMVRRTAVAAQNGDISELERLISQGVDINTLGTSNATILFCALLNKDSFEYLLKQGANPNVQFKSGGSVIHAAAVLESTALLELVLRYGGDPNIKDLVLGETPLFSAVLVDNAEAIRVLIEYGADTSVYADDLLAGELFGNSPLIFALYVEHVDSFAMLVEMGADIYQMDKNWGVPVAQAAKDLNSMLERPSEELKQIIQLIENKQKELEGEYVE
ncbi:ankyrin repeat domain-containing protein [Vibrio hippocampi]|uniref:Ankyrin repeat domain-containing protein n=1 Tax=Vibrio hippocampi TaxID=654686 RepID=A0ABN8DCV6_9VIBR|nr:ankyrin repeat domain-containing protein [Vibrio hippocampi]CAH0524618.1 hypothetical protein VHP8226_00466 [Vibrio hippocampi]